MTSKVILNSPEILDESLVNLTEACQCFPGRCSRPAVERWIRHGSRGIVLESVLICGKRYTSREAIDRFIRGQLQAKPSTTHLEPQKTCQKNLSMPDEKCQSELSEIVLIEQGK